MCQFAFMVDCFELLFTILFLYWNYLDKFILGNEMQHVSNLISYSIARITHVLFAYSYYNHITNFWVKSEIVMLCQGIPTQPVARYASKLNSIVMKAASKSLLPHWKLTLNSYLQSHPALPFTSSSREIAYFAFFKFAFK